MGVGVDTLTPLLGVEAGLGDGDGEGVGVATGMGVTLGFGVSTGTCETLGLPTGPPSSLFFAAAAIGTVIARSSDSRVPSR